MKKLLILIMIFPMIIYAECDEAKHKEYEALASNVESYSESYSKSTKTFEITVYNIFDGLYIKYNKKTYMPNENSEVVISNLKEGTNLLLEVFADDGCSAIKPINISLKYYNPYYNESICRDYRDKVSGCFSQFTLSEITKDNLEKEIYNYEHRVKYTEKEAEPQVDNSLFTKIKAFVKEWGIKIGLAVLTIIISSTLYNIKFRKIKHGI